MSLLGMPVRIPVVGKVYRIPPDLYDPYDRTGHPVLVVSVDVVLKTAEIVTRTTKAHAKGPGGVAHPAQSDLGLYEVGWWRVKWPKRVPFPVFTDPDVELSGSLDDSTLQRVLRSLAGQGGVQ